MKIRGVFAWYDLWAGGYYDRKGRELFLMIPMVGVAIHFHRFKRRGCWCDGQYCRHPELCDGLVCVCRDKRPRP